MIATESGHWYTKDGAPAYTVPNASKGGERPTTLRDARKLDLVPSVTTILKAAAAPGLERWKINTAILAARTLPMLDDETEDQFILRVQRDWPTVAQQAADKGTDIHGQIERADPDSPFYTAAAEAIKDLGFSIESGKQEKSFSHPLGFGGKVDWHRRGLVVDWKSKEFGPDDKVSGWPEQVMQLAAYREGVGYPLSRCANVFLSTTHPGLYRIVEWPEQDLRIGWEKFKLLLAFWQLDKQMGSAEFLEAMKARSE